MIISIWVWPWLLLAVIAKAAFTRNCLFFFLLKGKAASPRTSEMQGGRGKKKLLVFGILVGNFSLNDVVVEVNNNGSHFHCPLGRSPLLRSMMQVLDSVDEKLEVYVIVYCTSEFGEKIEVGVSIFG